MDSCIILQPAKVIPEYPFSDPEASKGDLAVIRSMITHLQELTRSNPTPAVYLDRQDDDGARHRLVVPNWTALQQKRDLIAVSFFGQLRPQVDHGPLYDVEEEIRGRLPAVGGLLAYCSLLGSDRGYRNLVLFRSERAKARWRGNAAHVRVVDLTRHHYDSVRLHNGVVRGGLRPEAYELVRTKYYDYHNNITWRAIREYYL
jgi:hypothetical protein